MSALLTLIRILLAAAGGYLVKDGILTSSDLTELVAAVLTLVPIAWGFYKNYHKDEQLNKVQAGATPEEAKASTPILAK